MGVKAFVVNIAGSGSADYALSTGRPEYLQAPRCRIKRTLGGPDPALCGERCALRSLAALERAAPALEEFPDLGGVRSERLLALHG